MLMDNMDNTEPNSEKAVAEIFASAATKLRSGLAPTVVEQDLIREEGLDAESAAAVVNELCNSRENVLREQGNKNVLYGALWFFGGLLVTLLSLSAGGGTFILAYGAIIGGAVQAISGLMMIKKAENNQW
jgi:hypothetical protein